LTGYFCLLNGIKTVFFCSEFAFDQKQITILNRKHMRACCRIIFLICVYAASISVSRAEQPETLKIGAQAPDFNLTGVDGKKYTLKTFAASPVLAIVFTCNHCPTAQAYEERIKKITSDFKANKVAVVAISSNDPKAIRLDELGYTDLSDTYEEMKVRAKDMAYNFPYLFDGDDQKTALAYGPVATPHIFIFDKDRKLQYSGRMTWKNRREHLKIRMPEMQLKPWLPANPFPYQQQKRSAVR
jgi:peroxiredoxin